MNRAMAMVLLTGLCGGLSGPPALAQSGLQSLPPMLSTVSDEVGVMTLAEGQTLAKTLADIEARSGVTVIVVILATTRPESIEAYVQRLIDHWRRESERLDHGRFVFVATAKEDRALRIVPSEPLAWLLPEIGKGELATKVPALMKQDRYFEAMTAIAQRLARLIDDRSRPARERVVFVKSHKEAPG